MTVTTIVMAAATGLAAGTAAHESSMRFASFWSTRDEPDTTFDRTCGGDEEDDVIDISKERRDQQLTDVETGDHGASSAVWRTPSV